MSDRRRRLSYATRCTDRHAVTVATWEADRDRLGFRLMVDGCELEAGTILLTDGTSWL